VSKTSGRDSWLEHRIASKTARFVNKLLRTTLSRHSTGPHVPKYHKIGWISKARLRRGRFELPWNWSPAFRPGFQVDTDAMLTKHWAMDQKLPSSLDRVLAKVCSTCPICMRARKKQGGLAWQFTSRVEEGLCPFCSAYERVHGRKAHDPVAAQGSASVR
jgi:hypothetical protein